MNDLISVIVPAYNAEKTIVRCLTSLVSQTYQNLEIVVVDDGSDDQTSELVNEFVEQSSLMIRYFHQENGGVTKARIFGTSCSSGDWIGFVDSDDEVESDMYNHLLSNAIKYNVMISHCGYQVVSENKNSRKYYYNTGSIKQQDRITGLRDLMTGDFIEPSLCNKLFHRSLFKGLLENNMIDQSIRINEDLIMNYILFNQSHSSVYEDWCPYHYIVRNNSASRSPFKPYKVMDPIKARKWILDHSEPSIQDVAWEMYLIRIMIAYTSLSKYNEYKAEQKQVRTLLIENRDKWVYLKYKEKLKLYLMLISPRVYNSIHSFYIKNKK